MKKGAFLALVSVALFGMTGCATNSNLHPDDPLEPLNRGIYKFNKGFDTVVTKPLVQVYRFIFPAPFQSMIGNLYFNIGEVPTFFNDVLQARLKQAGIAAVRFGINSTVGMLGIFDIASEIGLNRHIEDVGQTLGVWGYKKSSYFVIPILGPSTIRDTVGLAAYYYMSIPAYLEPSVRNPVLALQYVQKRSDFMKTEKVLNVAAIDEYLVVRDAYLQHRAYVIENKGDNDEKPKEDNFEAEYLSE